MCGIAGFMHFESSYNADRAVIKKMTDSIIHRGPDSEGFFIENNIALGHRRLSIIDINNGSQPMKSDDGLKIITFNGEIYNYKELREELIKHGFRFKTNSDTEVLIKAYEKWGYECQNKLNGMWAFVIWDKTKNELFLSRDRIGEKPLHYGIHNNSFVFGSEIKCLFEFGFERTIRSELIELYLSLTNIPAPHTFYKDIFKLMPGHFIVVKNKNFKEYKYWDLPMINESDMLTDKKDIYKTFGHLLSDSVSIRMRSDVPLGAFLSGGLDSSSIVALMSTISSRSIKTFTIGFSDKIFDESSLAKEISDQFKTEHHLYTVYPESFNSYLTRVYTFLDEPFGDSSTIPTDIISGFAAKKVKMVLTGDGGDEVLSGYMSYQGIKLANLLNRYPLFLRNGISGLNHFVSQIFKGNTRYKLNKITDIINTSSFPFNKRIVHKIAYTGLPNIRRLCAPLTGQISVEDYLDETMRQCSYKNDFYKLMYLNFKHDLPNDYLVKVDRMSMANSIETRAPFLDHRLIEYMVKVDLKIKMQGWERKSILRNTLAKELPNNILNAPKKGFVVPLREWFKGFSFEHYINNYTKKVYSVLDKKMITELIRANKEGREDNGNFIWTILILDKML